MPSPIVQTNSSSGKIANYSARPTVHIHTFSRSDSVYMVPPFLAYYGVVTRNKSAVAESYNQIRLYRQYLRDEGAQNLWKHMAFGDNQDTNHWSTGPPRATPLSARLILIRSVPA